MSGPAHLRVYRFSPGAVLEGAIVGALEQVELSGDAGLLDALFVTRDDTGELQAIDLATGRADGSIAALLDFRLDPAGRSSITQRTLNPHEGGVAPAVLEAVAAALEPGEAMLAVLVAGTVPATLEDAVSRSGGRVIADERVAAATLGEVAARLRAAL